jgi:diguanylate cyclase (GGDEF)-like protein
VIGALGAQRLKRWLDQLGSLTTVESEERALAGSVSGGLYLIGGATLAAVSFLPSVTHAHLAVLMALVAVCLAWGTSSLFLIDWRRAPRQLIHVSALLGFVLTAAAVASSGGAASPAWLYLFFIALFGSYFFRPAVALAYIGGCVATHALPLFYDPRALHDLFLARLVIAAPAYLAFGAAIISGKALMGRLRSRAEQLAAEQGSLRRVATAVVEGEPAERIYELVAREAAALLGAAAAGILRFDGEAHAIMMGSWADRDTGRDDHGTPFEVRPGSDLALARETNSPIRVDGHRPDGAVGRLGYTSSIVTPVRIGANTWGVLVATAEKAGQLRSGAEEQLLEFGNLLATAIISIEDREKLSRQASTDPLTGLANHRTLQRRLTAEVSRTVRHSQTLSVALIDIDHFKQINDIGGHEVGDEMLARVAECLNELARAEDTIARAGGDEFAWLLPETSRHQALVAVERARRAIASVAPKPYRITVSAGICDTSVTSDPNELIRFADGALYWSKAHGRNQCWIYDPAVIDELSAQERAERLERSQAIRGLRALARAIDAKDPATREHSERVATLVGKLAWVAGWSAERALLLSEAALVHDVGKIGVPDAVLRKTDPLTESERRQITAHAALSAQIVEGVLAPEQVDWIRTHHERPDGGGYPSGLTGEAIPEGGALLAVADAWDVMTVSRPYSVPKTPKVALEECVSLIGRQFTRGAVEALLELHARRELVSATDGAELAGASS